MIYTRQAPRSTRHALAGPALGKERETTRRTTTGIARPAPSRPGRQDVFRRQLARLGWGFTAPALIVIGAVTIFPILFSVIMSLSNVNVTGSGFTLNGVTGSNYSVLIHSDLWR